MFLFSHVVLSVALSALVVGDVSGRVVALPPTMASRSDVSTSAHEVNYCGTHVSPSKLAAAEDHFEATKRSLSSRQDGNVTSGEISVVFHVIYANETFEGGYIPATDIDAQIDVLNAAYAVTGYSFSLDFVEYVENKDWFLNVVNETSDAAINMKSSLRVGDEKTLNVYTIKIQGGTLGISAFPHDYQDEPQLDGIMLFHTTLPNSPVAPYNLGVTLIHETGHWVGLYHTFQGSCDEEGGGDRVVDTPAVSEPNFGCPAYIDSCKHQGHADLINNYMDYTDDACENSFTQGQIYRMQDQMRAYRGVDVVGF